LAIEVDPPAWSLLSSVASPTVRALVQRVTEARVRIGGAVVGEIGGGLCALVGVTHDDDAAAAARLAAKVWHLRVFDDPDGVMNLPVASVGGAVLVVSQFTLYGDTRRGRRPSWVAAAPPEQAEPLLDAFASALRELGAAVAVGRFGAHMQVELVNDGPVTLLVES
jgi:D-tyrosyl-tRNA(Tyr) deacylase